MKKSIFFFIFFIVFVSCEKNKNKLTEKPELKEEIVFQNYSNTMSFKYEDINEVIIYSFHDKEFIRLIDGDLRKDVNFNPDVQLSNDFIKERIVLNENQKSELYKLIIKDSCNREQLVSDCYNPRHQIVFKGNDDKVLGDIEICFSCGNIETSKSIGEAKYFCLDYMRIFFEEIGVKYFINDDDGGRKTEEEQKEIERIFRTLPKKIK